MKAIGDVLHRYLGEFEEMPVLVLFDIDGTLVRSFMREGKADSYDEVEVLPGRLEVLRALRESGIDVALVTNQGGVAFGYQTEEQVHRKMRAVLLALGLDAHYGGCTKPWFFAATVRSPYYVAFMHEHAKVSEQRQMWEAYPDWRKPGGEMIEQAMRDYDVSPERTLFVGDMDTDRQAAEAAGVAYADAGEFFA